MDHKAHIIVALILVIFFHINYHALSWSLRKLKNDPELISLSLDEFVDLNNKIITPTNNGFQCVCGCYQSQLPDCPPLYDLSDVEASAMVKMTKELEDYMAYAQSVQKRLGVNICGNVESRNEGIEMVTFSGGYCFHYLNKLALEDEQSNLKNITLPGSHRSINIPQGVLGASPDFLLSLYSFIEQERIRSIGDFGAGIGLYGKAIQEYSPSIVYRGYDGAPGVEDYTYGYIKYLDMSSPANIPMNDWVISLDVGQYIPSNFEGNYIRNLHAHNCRGVILSWETPEQPGKGRVNLHNNDYLIRIFSELGYAYDRLMTTIFRDGIQVDGSDTHFRQSILIFRRNRSIC